MATLNPPWPSRPPPGVPRPTPEGLGRIWHWVTRLSPHEGWLSALLVYLLLLSVIWSVERAEWVPDAPNLPWLALGATLTGLVLAKLRFPGVLLHLVGLGLGFVVAAWRTAALVPASGWGARIDQFDARLRDWAEALKSGSISGDILPFAFLLALAIWILGYFGSWYIFRSRNPWPAVVLTGFAILTNLSYLPPAFYFHFAVFLILAMLVVANVTLVRQREIWRERKVETPEWLGLLSLNDRFWFTLVILMVAWFSPLWKATPGLLEEGWVQFRRPWIAIEEVLDRAFSGLPSHKAVPVHSFGPALPFRGSIVLGDEVVFQVSSPFPGYWRGRSYDIYTRRGWLSSDPITKDLEELSTTRAAVPPSAVQVTHRVVSSLQDKISFVPGVPIASETPLVAEVAKAQVFSIDLEDTIRDQELPPDLRRVAAELRRQFKAAGGGEEAIFGLLPPGFKLVRIVREQGLPVEYQVSRIEAGEDVLVLKPSSGKAKDYSVVTWMPSATEEELRQVEAEYPPWITERYLQLPQDFPDGVRQLSQELTQPAPTLYDKTVAIESYLRTFRYTKVLDPPPFDADGVEYLLSVKEGYSDYFASAMAVMLRSVGIPARIAVGYATGDFDPATRTWVVRDLHSHGWPEVFFPGYGWLNFEPTPTLEVVRRGPPPPQPLGEEPTEEPSIDDFLLEEELFLPSGEDSASRQQGSQPLWRSALPFLLSFGGLLVAVLALFHWWRRGLAGHPVAMQTYGAMYRMAWLAGRGRRRSQTPGEFGNTLSTWLPAHGPEIRLLTDEYSRGRYGKKSVTEDEEAGLRTAWRQVRVGLLRLMLLSRLPKWRRRKIL